MNEFKFKTNIDCGGCVNAVTNYLNDVKGILRWSVDTSIPEKILTVESDTATDEEIINAVKKAGFNIEKI
ncbi:heavy-metal-associated domain-containing protein [Apibacter raozihei]|uniref:heavy-metal-associated domain-containing protein n=1 Tax=Apibacter raozihei TaxID=2500547 RepID=UPI000FE34A42|nr:heavy-metal-associated domain-containing protein [Apibacter raozihei]